MKPIEYRAKIEVDDMAPLEAHEYAKQKLRMTILDDQEYQLEILKDFAGLEKYVQSQIEYQEKELQRWIRTPFFTRFITGDNVHAKIDTCHEVLINLKSILAYINKTQEARNYQLKKKQDERPR
jgi:predicted NACHT family NTPase